MVLAELRGADKIDWSHSAVDSSSIRAVGGGEATGPNPTDRARPGTKHHVLVDGHGVPLAVSITGANVPDVKQLLPLVVAIPEVRGKPGHLEIQAQGVVLRTVRFRTGTPNFALAGDSAISRQTRHRARQRPGNNSLGRGENHQLAASTTPTAGSLRAQGRHPLRLSHTRRESDMFPYLPEVLLGALIRFRLRMKWTPCAGRKTGLYSE